MVEDIDLDDLASKGKWRFRRASHPPGQRAGPRRPGPCRAVTLEGRLSLGSQEHRTDRQKDPRGSLTHVSVQMGHQPIVA